jgi:hypothetical protein
MERALFVDNSLGNMQTLCVECHRKKTTMFMRERSSQAMVLRRAGDMEVRRRETEMEARKRQTRERLEEERRFRNEVACIEREILEAQGVKFAPRDVGDRVQYVLDHVHAYIDGQIAENGDWPKTLQPIASDYAADLWTVGGD